MPSYTAPLREYRFLLKDVLDIERYSNLPTFSDAPIDLIDQVLEEGAKFCEGVLAPLNKVGDEHGCKRSDDGSVTTPPGFKDAYKQFVEAGWPALSSDPAYGGQGMPHVVALAWSEMCSQRQHGVRDVSGPVATAPTKRSITTAATSRSRPICRSSSPANGPAP